MTLDAKLAAVYVKIPAVTCLGRCHEACGPIAMSTEEARRLTFATMKRPTFDQHGSCVYLTADKRCSTYSLRPAICRLYGVAEDLVCEFGCQPERLLSRAEAFAILSEIDDLSDGEHVFAQQAAAQ